MAAQERAKQFGKGAGRFAVNLIVALVVWGVMRGMFELLGWEMTPWTVMFFLLMDNFRQHDRINDLRDTAKAGDVWVLEEISKRIKKGSF